MFKITGAGAAPKQDGSETLVSGTSLAHYRRFFYLLYPDPHPLHATPDSGGFP